ncbi:MAG: 16S rRNA (guanine(966)-N(2))-methyltransferase RsmD [Planctomycetota bacterium]|nr:16S rRNA (guanine(966)-N(2))-methyltransferase RsmD [Planctomycetota bacterium]
MRITGGDLSGRKILAPSGLLTRPAPDILRVALFNILKNRLKGSVVLDLFAGTGILSFDSLSRGASFAVLVENSRAALEKIKQNADKLNLKDKVQVINYDVFKIIPVLRHLYRSFSVVFIDPPYALLQDPEMRLKLFDLIRSLYNESNLLTEDAVTMLRYSKGDSCAEEMSDSFQVLRRRSYGTTEFALLARKGLRIVLGTKHPFDRKEKRKQKKNRKEEEN